MERLLIIVAVLVCAAAGVAVVAMSARTRRGPLRMDSEFDADDAELIIGPIGAPQSPIDRSAQVIEPDGPPAVEASRAVPPERRLPDAAR